MKVKCFRCKEKEEKELMICEESGNKKITRKYFHYNCHEEYKKEREIKEQDVKELDDLYQYLLKLHKVDLLDGRMMEKIQDLRNGSIKFKGKKIKKYKQGVRFSLMLDTYRHIENNIDYILRTNQFEEKWNEFSYIFGTMVRNIQNVKEIEKSVNRVNQPVKINKETIELTVKKSDAKDELDISEFL